MISRRWLRPIISFFYEEILKAFLSWLIRPYGSRDSLQVAWLLQVVNIPAISPSARSAELSWSFYKEFLRTVLANGFQARAMADLIEYFHWNYGIDSNGTFLRTAWCLSIQHQTFCIGQVEYITPTNYERRLKTVVERLKRAVHSSCFYPPSPYSICKSC